VAEQQVEKSPQEQLADARAELDELQGLIDGLEEQVREGDDREAEMELGRQYGLKRLAELRREAAERRASKAVAEEKARRRLEAEAAAQADLEQLGVDRLASALDTAVQALADLKALGDARQAALERHARAYVDLGMKDRIVHQDGHWVRFQAGGAVYDTNQDQCSGNALLALVQQELKRRELIPDRVAKGFTPLEPIPHPVTRYLAERAGDAA
jgi:hypothetical protein